MTSVEIKKEIDQDILRSNSVIERHIDNLEINDRGMVSPVTDSPVCRQGPIQCEEFLF